MTLKNLILILFVIGLSTNVIFAQNEDATLTLLKQKSDSLSAFQFYQFVQNNISQNASIDANFFIVKHFEEYQNDYSNGNNYSKLIMEKATLVLDNVFQNEQDTAKAILYSTECLNTILGVGSQKEWIKIYDAYFSKFNQYLKNKPNNLAEILSLYSLMFSYIGNFEKSEQLINLANKIIDRFQGNGSAYPLGDTFISFLEKSKSKQIEFYGNLTFLNMINSDARLILINNLFKP